RIRRKLTVGITGIRNESLTVVNVADRIRLYVDHQGRYGEGLPSVCGRSEGTSATSASTSAYSISDPRTRSSSWRNSPARFQLRSCSTAETSAGRRLS